MLLRNQRPNRRSAFTLMEIIVVVAIILILAGAGIFVYTGVLADTRVNRAKMDVHSIEQAVQTYKVNNGYYPQTLQELTQRQPNNSAALLKPHAIINPWNQPYHFDAGLLHPETGAPLVWSDGEPGDPDGKITSWQEELKRSFWEKVDVPALWLALVAIIVTGLIHLRRKFFVADTFPAQRARLVIDLVNVLLVFGLWCYLMGGRSLD